MVVNIDFSLLHTHTYDCYNCVSCTICQDMMPNCEFSIPLENSLEMVQVVRSYNGDNGSMPHEYSPLFSS